MIPLETNMYYTYVLQSKKDGRWYTGATNDLRKRFAEHSRGEVFATKNRGPFILIYYEACTKDQDAFAREKFLKSGQGKRFLKNRIKRFLFLTGRVPKNDKGACPVRSQTSVMSATSNRGFIALMSAIVISAILLLVVVTASTKGFFGRANILEAEYKERSVAIAEACADTALLYLASNINYYDSAGGTVSISGYTCTISQATPAGASAQKTFKTRAIFQNSYTNLEIIINTADISIDSWKEIPTF